MHKTQGLVRVQPKENQTLVCYQIVRLSETAAGTKGIIFLQAQDAFGPSELLHTASIKTICASFQTHFTTRGLTNLATDTTPVMTTK